MTTTPKLEYGPITHDPAVLDAFDALAAEDTPFAHPIA